MSRAHSPHWTTDPGWEIVSHQLLFKVGLELGYEHHGAWDTSFLGASAQWPPPTPSIPINTPAGAFLPHWCKPAASPPELPPKQNKLVPAACGASRVCFETLWLGM